MSALSRRTVLAGLVAAPAGEGVGPGEWMYHCHVQAHSDFGMVGHWHIEETT